LFLLFGLLADLSLGWYLETSLGADMVSFVERGWRELITNNHAGDADAANNKRL
jgi:hypothetical protein